MKMLVEKAHTLIGESKDKKNYYIKGIFSTIGQKNANGRVYSREIWEKAVEDYQRHIKEPTMQSLMEFDHPSDRVYVDPLKAIAKIEELYIDGDYVMGKAKLLETDEANRLKNIIDEGIPIGVSSRGVGEVMNSMVTEYELITYDIVANPSDFNALTQGINESFDNGVLLEKEFERREDGKIVEVKNKNIINEKKTNSINKEVLNQFATLFSKF